MLQQQKLELAAAGTLVGITAFSHFNHLFSVGLNPE